MSLDSLPTDSSLLTALRARQLTSRTAQMARTLDGAAVQQPGAGAFNASAAAALNGWSKG